MIPLKPLLTALLLGPPAASLAAAGSLSDLILAPGLFKAAPDGEVLAYDHVREAPPVLPRANLAEGRLLLTAGDGPRGRALALTREEEGQVRPVAEFPASGPNPVLLYFLETTARNMADATGGSPFYIRNRMREALVGAEVAPEAGEGPVTVTMQPFEHDANRGRMGIFADLVIGVRFMPEEPGQILELSADTAPVGDGYHDRLTLIAED